MFLKKGYQATTTDEIARSVGLTKGALYFHFKNKEELVYEIFRSFSRLISDTIREVPDAKATPANLFKVMIETKLGFPEADFANYLDFWGQAVRIRKVRRLLQDTYEEFDELFANKTATTFPVSKAERKDMAVLVGALYDGLWSRMLLAREDINLNRIKKIVDSFVLSKKTNK